MSTHPIPFAQLALRLTGTVIIREELAKQAYDTANKGKAEPWIRKAKEKNHQP